jgi:large subunit ribosomal protein L24
MLNKTKKSEFVIRYKVRRGDLVTVISGRDKGKSGKVLLVLPKLGKVLVEHVAVVKRHTKPNQKNQMGGIVEKEASFPISKVMVLDPSNSLPSRLGRKKLNDGTLVRFAKKSGHTLEPVKSNR